MEDNPFNPRSTGGPAGSRSRFSWKASLVYGWVAFLVLLCLFVVWHKVTNEDAQLSTQANEQIEAGEIIMPDLNVADDGLATSAKDKTLEVNGQLKVNNSLVFDPSDPPTDPIRGQVYYDKTSNVPMYYDGERFVAVATTQDVEEATRPIVQVAEPDTRDVSVEVPADIAQTGKSNTFTQDNLFMQDLSVSGFTALQSTSIASLVLSQPLGVASGGTGASSFASGSVVVGNGSGALSSVSAGSTGLCLMSTSSGPSFQTCPSGASTPNAVTSTSNTSGNLARFGAGNTLIDSLLSDNGSEVSVAGNLNLGAHNLQLGNNGFGMTLNTTTLSANRTISLPNESGTVCLQNSSACGFVTGTPANFIQNQNVGAQAGSNYWVAGVGRADGGLIGPSLDSAGGVLAIGGNASAVSINDDTTVNGTLRIATSNASVNAPNLLVEQSGTGDSTIELKDGAGNSFYVGMDRSAGSVLRIGSSTNARTTNSVGYLTQGGSAFTNVDAQITAKKVTTGPADAGSLSSIAVHLSQVDPTNRGIKVALYAHDGVNDRPGTLVASVDTEVTGTAGWNVVPLSAPITSSTTYWLAVNAEGGGTGLSYSYCGGCAGDSTTTYPRPFNGAWPTTHGAPNNTLDSQEWSFYMNVASGGVNDAFAGAKLFSMTDTGALTLQNGIDTNAAFQIQNAAGAAVVNVNTLTGRVSANGLDIADSIQMSDNGFGLTLNTTPLSANQSIALPNESGTLCIQNSTNCGFVTGSPANFIQNQLSGAQTGANFWIAGEGRAGMFSSGTLHTQYLDAREGSGDSLIIGNAHATSILIGHYGKSVVSAGQLSASQGIVVNDLGLTLQGSTASYTTPLGYNLSTMINIPNYTVPDFSSIFAFGLPSTSSASARGLLIADARAGSHQPTIGILSPNESDIFGMSWDGSNGVARLKTLGAGVGIRLNANDVAQFENSQIYLNQSTQVTGGLQVNGTSVFTPTTDSTDVFRIQGADTSAVILRADTVANKLIVRTLDVDYNLTVGGNVTFAGHLRSGGGTPTRVIGPAACTAASVSVTGTDTSGMITVTAGTGCSAGGAIMAVVFANAFSAAPRVTLTPATASAASLPVYVDHTQVTNASFDIASSTPLTDGVQYRWYYHAIE